jgi:Tol biopolymer transport system component
LLDVHALVLEALAFLPGPIWSPGGRAIALTRLTGRSNDVWSMRPDGSVKPRLTTGVAHEAAGGWAREP